jgi:hypothetical protein
MRLIAVENFGKQLLKIADGWMMPDTYLHASNALTGKYLHVSGYSFSIGNQKTGDCRNVIWRQSAEGI